MKTLMLILFIFLIPFVAKANDQIIPGKYICDEDIEVIVEKLNPSDTMIGYFFQANGNGSYPCVTYDKYKINYYIITDFVKKNEFYADGYNKENRIVKSISSKQYSITSLTPLSFTHPRVSVTLYPTGDTHCSPALNYMEWRIPSKYLPNPKVTGCNLVDSN